MESQHKQIIEALEEALLVHPDRASIIRKAESTLALAKTPEEGLMALPELLDKLTDETNKRGPWRSTLQ